MTKNKTVAARLISITQVGERFGCGRSKAIQIAAEERFTRIKIGRLTKYSATEIDEAIDRRIAASRREAA